MRRIEILPWAEALATHHDAWHALVVGRNLDPTLSPGWVSAIVDTLLEPADVRVLVERDISGLVGVIPFHVRSGHVGRLPVRILEPVSSLLAYHAELATRGDPATLLDALLAPHDGLRWDLCRLTGILAGSTTAAQIPVVCRQRRLITTCTPGPSSPYMPVPAGGWSALVAARNKRDRYLIRRHAKDFAAQNTHGEFWVKDAQDVPKLLAAMLHVEAQSWKAGAGIAISGNPRETRYYERLLPWLAGEGLLVANVLTIAGTPVAYNLNYEWAGRVASIKGTYDEHYAKIAVGHHSQERLIERVADAGAHEIDFLGDADPYKLSWSSMVRRHEDWFIHARRGRGRWLGLIQRLRHARRQNAAAGETRDRGPLPSG